MKLSETLHFPLDSMILVPAAASQKNGAIKRNDGERERECVSFFKNQDTKVDPYLSPTEINGTKCFNLVGSSPAS